MRLKTFRGFLSLSLALMILVCGSITVNAGEIFETGLTGAVNQNTCLPDEDKPEAVEQELITEKGHIARLYDKETDLDTIVFSNQDGTETIYIFDEAVKYVDSNGIVADKSNLLYDADEVGYAYVNEDNDIQTSFPAQLNNITGLNLAYGDISIVMYPADTVSSAATKRTDNTESEYVYYDNAFGQNTSLRYKPTFSGFKEEIILYENVGSQFSFIMECGTLVATIENNNIIIRNPDTGDIVATMDAVFLYDSYTGVITDSVHETWNNVTTLSKLEDGKYNITITLDSAFLSNPDTVYPVYVDPSITINASGSGTSKKILDTPIYNGSGVTGNTSGANSSAVIGYVGTLGGVQYGSGRLLMRFPGLMSQSFMRNQNYIISSATLYMHEVSGNSATATISAHIYTGPAWSESSTYSSSIWNGVYKKNGSEQTLSTYAFSYPNSTTGSFNITQAVRLWQSNSSYGQKGIILKNKTSESDLTYYKSLYTSEGSTKPYLSVTYSNRSVADNALLSYGSSTRTLTIRLLGTTTTNSTWLPIVTASCNAWNNSNADTNITTTTTGTSAYTLTVDAFSTETWYGLTTTTLSGGVAQSAKIEINTSTLGSSTSFRRSTVTHEIGHLLWLKDNPSTSDYSLMRHDRDREIIYIPQMIDIYHMLTKY